MTRRIATIAAGVLAVCSLTGCQYVRLPEGVPWPADLKRGARVDVVMVPEGDIVGRCDMASGELTWSPVTGEFTCEVDIGRPHG